MSAILFNNPYAAPPPAVQTFQPAIAGTTVTAIPSADGAASSKDASLSNGNGTGSEMSKQAENVAILQTRQNLERPVNATGDSVINAQAQSSSEDVQLGPELPEVDMPDPLPTSPFLLQLKEAS